MIFSSDELMRALAEDLPNRGPIELAAGDYYLVPPERYISREICGVNPTPYATRIHVENRPIKPGHYSEFAKLTFLPIGDNFAFEMDHSSRTLLRRLIIQSPLQADRERNPRIEAWNNILRSGGGIRTTNENIGDDAWEVKFDDVLLQALEYGIKTEVPRPNPVDGKTKGTIHWVLNNVNFNACRYNIWGERIGEWKIYGGIQQLAELSFYLDGSGNVMRDVKFERNNTDILYSDNSCANAIDLCNAAPWKMNAVAMDKVLMNRYRRLPTSAIWRPCDRPGKKKQLLAAAAPGDLWEDHDGFVYSRSEEEAAEREGG